jgi:hypothetical protein
MLSYDCKNEIEYLAKTEKLTRQMLQVEGFKLDGLFWGNPPKKVKLDFTLQKILDNIEKIKKTPIDKRHYD